MLMLRRPFGGMLRFGREFDDLCCAQPSNGNQVDFAPAVDIEEQGDHFVVSADLPGVNEKDIDVSVHDGVLRLSGKREMCSQEQTEAGHYRERRVGSFFRSFTLGEAVDSQKIEAIYKNGVLTVKLPKKEETKPRQIPVSSN